MSNTPDIDVMRDVLSGKVGCEDIPSLPTRAAKVSAAVAYIFLHGNMYLAGDRFVVSSYGKLLKMLTGEPCADDYLSTASGRLGLHETVPASDPRAPRIPGRGRSTIVQLKPLSDWGLDETKVVPTAPHITSSDEARATSITNALLSGPPGTAYATYLKLKERFKQ